MPTNGIPADIDPSTFWAHVDSSGGPQSCWPWTRAMRSGYGRLPTGGRAHRAAYILINGPIPDGLLVCHACDNPPCCNPAHLFAGTNRDNIADMLRKGRSARGGKNGTWTHPERVPRGGAHPHAKLTDDIIADIRARAACGEARTSIANTYGVSCSNVNLIVNRKTWRHVP